MALTAHVMNLCWGDGAVGKGTCCHIGEPKGPEFNLRASNGRREVTFTPWHVSTPHVHTLSEEKITNLLT